MAISRELAENWQRIATHGVGKVGAKVGCRCSQAPRRLEGGMVQPRPGLLGDEVLGETGLHAPVCRGVFVPLDEQLERQTARQKRQKGEEKSSRSAGERERVDAAAGLGLSRAGA